MTMPDENLDDVISSLIDTEEEDKQKESPAEVHEDAPVSDHPVTLTARAAKQINKIRRDEDLEEGLFLRMAVEGGGCSGLNYKLGFDYKTGEDRQVESEGISIVIDPRHLIYLDGVLIDYPDGLDARGFTFDNPNATENCGCGASFAI
ncbi:MAG: iron-sulfur cluster assembly accessory protein [Balneolaceae bacterium]